MIQRQERFPKLTLSDFEVDFETFDFGAIKDRWPVIERNNPLGTINVGYKLNQENTQQLLPDWDIIPFFERAFDLNQSEYGVRRVLKPLNEVLESKGFKTISSGTFNTMFRKYRLPYLDAQTISKKRKRFEGYKNKKIEEIVVRKRKAVLAKNRVEKELKEIARKQAELRVKKELAKDPKRQKIKLEAYSSTQEPTREELVEREFQRIVEEQKLNVIFRANPGPQEEFLASDEQEVLYGGAAGGGKSYAMLADPMRYFNNKNFRGLLVRRTNDELKELKQKSKELYFQAFPEARWSERDSQWTFPSGATLWMTYLEKDDDVLRYQGQSFTWIGFDELTQYPTAYPWNYLRSRLRSTDPSLPLYMRATANPGGPGHMWVKKMFIDPHRPNEAFWATDIETGQTLVYPEHDPLGRGGQPLFKRKFIPAKLYDNPYLTLDGSYERNLLSLPEIQRRRLLEGDWNASEGAAFPEFMTSVHVVEPFEIPKSWMRFRSCDYGYSTYSAVLYFAVDPNYGTLYVYRELYVSKHTAQDLADLIKKTELEAGDKIRIGVLDSSTWHQRGHRGPSIAEEMILRGVHWRPSDRSQGSRIAGKNEIHKLLKYDPNIDRPGLLIFDTCRQLIQDLASIPSDPNGGEDVDPKYTSDHTYDALRYGVMSRLMNYSHSGFENDAWGLSPATTSRPQGYIPQDKIFGY